MEAYADKILVELIEDKPIETKKKEKGKPTFDTNKKEVNPFIKGKIISMGKVLPDEVMFDLTGKTVLLDGNIKGTPVPDGDRTLYLFRRHNINIIL